MTPQSMNAAPVPSLLKKITFVSKETGIRRFHVRTLQSKMLKVLQRSHCQRATKMKCLWLLCFATAVTVSVEAVKVASAEHV